LLFLLRIKYKIFRNKILHTGRINHRLHSGIFFLNFFKVQILNFLQLEKTSSMELVLHIDVLVSQRSIKFWIYVDVNLTNL
jgi:hypothetical protein